MKAAVRRKCAREGCEETFEVGSFNAHQKYHSASCGDAARRRWRKPSRREYMRIYKQGYIPKDMAS